MLSVYTRHYSPCTQADSNHRRCHCPKWINGTLPTGKFVRVSAKTQSWENAERKARIMEVNADPLRQTLPDVSLRITIEEAVRDFLRDEEARQLAKTTTCQSKTLFQKQLLEWAKGESLRGLSMAGKEDEWDSRWSGSRIEGSASGPASGDTLSYPLN